MDDIKSLICQARRRLWLNRWLVGASWTLAGASSVYILAVILQRSLLMLDETPALFFGVIGGLLAVALPAATLWMFMTRETLAVAAARLDESAGLKERLGSSLYCTDSSDPFAQAVVTDARRSSRGIIVRQLMPVRVPREATFAGGAILLALVVTWLFPALDLAGTRKVHEKAEQEQELVKRTQAQINPAVRKTIEEIRKQVPALKQDMPGLDPLREAQPQTPLDVRREALKAVEKLDDQLKKRQNSEEMAKAAEFQKILRQLADSEKSNSPVNRLAQSMAKGNFKEAQNAIAEIQKQLSQAPKTEAERRQAEALKQQLEQLSARLDQIARDERNIRDKLSSAGLSKEELQQAIRNIADKDFDAVAKQLADKGLSQQQVNQMMQELKKRQSACSAAGKLAQNLQSACRNKNGQGRQGSSGQGQASESDLAGLSAAGQQLSEMESLQQEMGQISSAMANLNSARDQIGNTCKACQGTGIQNGRPCGSCQGSGMAPGPNSGQGSSQTGMGQNPGQGQGNVAPEQKTDFRLNRQRTPVITAPGSIIHQKFIDGEQFKGELSSEFKEAMISADREATDAINREQIPRIYHSSVKNYFTRATKEMEPEKADAEGQKADGK